MRVLKRILGHSREEVKVAGNDERAEAAAVRLALFTERCDGDEHFKGADRTEL